MAEEQTLRRAIAADLVAERGHARLRGLRLWHLIARRALRGLQTRLGRARHHAPHAGVRDLFDGVLNARLRAVLLDLRRALLGRLLRMFELGALRIELWGGQFGMDLASKWQSKKGTV